LINALLAIGIVSILRFARLVRSTDFDQEQDFVIAARSIAANQAGCSSAISCPPVDAADRAGTLGIATAIPDAALSFLGLGAEPPRPEWGLMLGEERNSIFNAPHLVFFPGVAIMLTAALNLLGDGSRRTDRACAELAIGDDDEPLFFPGSDPG
jgi:ABC-type dipeptide/oligopeptide/nickel transport system permease subunit